MKLFSWEKAQEEIKEGIILLQFTTNWCGDCKMMKPIIKNVEKKINEFRNDVKFIEVDAEEAKLFREKNSDFQVLKVPSYYVIKNSEKIHLGYKYLPEEEIIKYFK